MDDLVLSHATERDVDLLVVEELVASREFVSEFIELVAADIEIENWVVLHSKRRLHNRREIDIELSVNGRAITLLIENKLDTSEQLNQAESYRAEVEQLRSTGEMAHSVLMCPQRYAETNGYFASKFDSIMSYEKLRSHFTTRLRARECDFETSLRLQHRASLLDQAIEKSRRGYVQVPIKIIGDFNKKYCALIAKEAPVLRPGPSMLKDETGAESTSMIFDAKRMFSVGVAPRRFSHELGKGSDRRANYAAATFARWGAAYLERPKLIDEYLVQFGYWAESSKPSKRTPSPGLIIAVDTPPVFNEGDFDEQIDAVRMGVEKTVELLQWILTQQATLLNWRQIYERE